MPHNEDVTPSLPLVKMIGDQRPCKALGLTFLNDYTEPFQEKIPIRIIIKYLLASNSSGNNIDDVLGYPIYRTIISWCTAKISAVQDAI
jgi:hypothetical protein